MLWGAQSSPASAQTVAAGETVINQASVTYRDARLNGLDAIVLMEVIEHVDMDRLPALIATVFKHARPMHVLASTPNKEHNETFESLEENGLRHPDHRWEMTRTEFADWTQRVAGAHKYSARIVGIGEEHPDFGHPTQMAIFTRETQVDAAEQEVPV